MTLMKIYKLLFVSFFFISKLTLIAQNQGHNIKIKFRDFKGPELYLGFNYGDKKFISDTAKINKNGEYVFSGPKPLEGGIYLAILPSKKYFEFVVDEQNFSIETDTVDFIKNAKIKGSENNVQFFAFVNYVASRQSDLMRYKSRVDNLEAGNDSIKFYQEKMTAIEKEISDYRMKIIEKYPNLFIADLFNAMREPVVPDPPKLPNGNIDSSFGYKYFKAHYFDHFKWNDDKLAKTPLLHNKMKYYLDKLTVQVPDSIIKSADWLIEQASGSKELYKYIVHYITSTYERSNVMGMENVFVHVAKKYYTPKKAFWADSATVAKIQERADALEPLLIGKIAPNIALADTSTKKWYSLYKVNSPYTILYFWDPDCGHCQKVTPKLVEIYHKFKPKGFDVFAVCTQRDTEKWKKFVDEKKMVFTNVAMFKDVADHPEKYIYELKVTDINSINFHKTYDIYSTPQVYVLDKDKKIIARRLGVEDLEGFLDNYLKNKAAN